MANIFLMPSMVFIGEDALSLSKAEIVQLGKKALIVTDDMMVGLKNVEIVTEMLDKIGVEYYTFDKINTEPTEEMVEEGIRAYKANNCDFLIGIGGGSPLDAMKAIGLLATNEGRISDYNHQCIKNNLPPTVCIPTTAGTGSETTKSSIITNQKTGIKMLISDPKLMAKIAIIDPKFTLTVPKDITVATGIDALTHAIEAYTSKKACQLSDVQSLSAVKRIFKSLLEAYDNGSNIKARSQMAIASFEAGIAFNNSSVTLVHGMSRPIGAMFHVPHGASNAMLLVKSLEFIRPEVVPRLNDLAAVIGILKPEMTKEDGAKAFVEETKKFLRKLSIREIKDYNIDREEFYGCMGKMAEDALASGSPGNTRKDVKKEDIIEIYKLLWEEPKFIQGGTKYEQ